MLAWLGEPDFGVIVSGYVGTLLLGAFFLSIGIFFSGFCRDQIIAFVVTLLACFLVFLLGTQFIASYIDDAIDGLGSTLSQLVGMIDHYTAFTRGVIELADILYFVAWTTLFVVLNIYFLGGRSRPGFRTTYGIAVAVCIAIGLAFNWLLTGQSLGRLDMTEDKVYTVSDASARILSKLDVPVQVKLYITPKSKMPTALKQLEQDIAAKVDELRVESKGKIDFSTIYLEAANVLSDRDMLGQPEEEEPEDEAESLEKRMLDKGLQPFSVQVTQADEATQKLIYSSVGIGYRAESEEFISPIMTQNLPELEYKLVNTIYKLTQEKAPRVAIFAPKESITLSAQEKQLYQMMNRPIPTSDDPYQYLEAVLLREKYEIERVELTQSSPLPDEYDTLVVVNPKSLSERQRWEIGRALHSGKSVVMAVQNEEWNYQVTREGPSAMRRSQDPGMNPLLEKWGLGISEEILMDKNHFPLSMQSGNPFEPPFSVNLPIQVLVNNNAMDKDTSITQRLDAIFYLWGAAVEVNEEEMKKHGIEWKSIMTTTEDAWQTAKAEQLTQAMITPPAEGEQYPLMILATGQFPDAFKDQSRPPWPPPQPTPGMPPPPPPEAEGQAAPVTPEPGKLILLGCSQMFRKEFLQAANLDLFLNAVDAVTLGEDLIHVRGHEPINRLIDKTSDEQRRFWKVLNYALMPVLLAVVGILVAVTRKRSRDVYTIEHVQ